jgi:hypothetical protein
VVGQSLAGSSTGGTDVGVELSRPQAELMSLGIAGRGLGVAGRAACSDRILEEDPGGDGPGVVLMLSFRVGALRPRRRPRLGQTPPKV